MQQEVGGSPAALGLLTSLRVLRGLRKVVLLTRRRRRRPGCSLVFAAGAARTSTSAGTHSMEMHPLWKSQPELGRLLRGVPGFLGGRGSDFVDSTSFESGGVFICCTTTTSASSPAVGLAEQVPTAGLGRGPDPSSIPKCLLWDGDASTISFAFTSDSFGSTSLIGWGLRRISGWCGCAWGSDGSRSSGAGESHRRIIFLSREGRGQ